MISEPLKLMLTVLGPEKVQRMLEAEEAKETEKLITSTLSLADLRLILSALGAYDGMLEITAGPSAALGDDMMVRFMSYRAPRERRRIEDLKKLIKGGIQKAGGMVNE